VPRSKQRKVEVGRLRSYRQRAFTLIELVVVLLLIGLLLGLIGFRTGTFSFWKEEGFVRQLTETVTFLHHQAVTDQAFYRLEFDFDHNTYRIGVMKSDFESDESLKDIAVEAGTLSIELAAMLNPSLGEDQTMIPHPHFHRWQNQFSCLQARPIKTSARCAA
jgi:prepilin-type N-terminal cleavage/methylation domain-containing protein